MRVARVVPAVLLPALLLGACLAPPGTATLRADVQSMAGVAAPGVALSSHGWSVVSAWHGQVLADRRTFPEADGNVITVFRYRVRLLVYALHTGSEDPPGVAAAVPASEGQAISSAEAPRLVGAFNGGFKVISGSGGFELGRRAFVPLKRGFASLVIYTDGSADVGAWGGSVPSPAKRVESVRQNLQLLISGGRASPSINDIAAWGVTLGGVPQVARSAVGVDRAGDLLYAGSMKALPVDLARALLGAGAVRAMELDINPYWVQLASATHPGGKLVGGVPNQERPADQYQVGWLRDFVTVLVRKK